MSPAERIEHAPDRLLANSVRVLVGIMPPDPISRVDWDDTLETAKALREVMLIVVFGPELQAEFNRGRQYERFGPPG